MADVPQIQSSGNTLESLQQQIVKRSIALKWGIGAGVILVLGPLFWMLFKALLGLAAVGAITIGMGVALIAFATWFPGYVERRKNAKLKALMDEWARNPIESLWNAHKEDKLELDRLSADITEYETAILTAESATEKEAKNLTQADLAGFAEDIKVLKAGLVDQESAWDEAMLAWKAQEVEIRRADTIWKLAGVFDKANQKSGKRDEVMARIKKDTALDAVTARLNRSKVTVRQRIRERASVASAGNPNVPTVRRIADAQSDVIELPSASVREVVPVQTAGSAR